MDAESKACDLFRRGCSGSTFAYMKAMYCQKGITRYMEGYDFVVINCGHHFAKHANFGYDFYTKAMRDLALEMRDFVYSGNHKTHGNQHMKYFYLESVAPPVQEDEVKLNDVDMRTYHRMMIHDAIAMRELRLNFGKLINSVSAFGSTLAMFDKLCDCTHYPWGARMPQLFALTDKLRRGYQLMKTP